jgi:transposase-like protein
MNLVEIFEKFPTEKKCIDHLEKIKWPIKPICPYCGNSQSSCAKEELRHHCNKCNTSFSVTVGTIFHQTHLPLQKWFLAIALILNAKKGISSRQLARDIKVTKDTAWSMQMRIRKALLENPELMKGVVEMDETYIGARKPRRTSKDKDDDGNYPKLPRGRGTTKTPVVGMVERGGKVKAMMHTELKFSDLKKTATKHIDFENTILMTDDYRGYIPFKHLLIHQSVNHSQKQWANGAIHTNTIESFWALLKRGITGQYHHLSDKYLNRYITEFCFKYNNRKTQDVFGLVLTNALGV